MTTTWVCWSYPDIGYYHFWFI